MKAEVVWPRTALWLRLFFVGLFWLVTEWNFVFCQEPGNYRGRLAESKPRTETHACLDNNANHCTVNRVNWTPASSRPRRFIDNDVRVAIKRVSPTCNMASRGDRDSLLQWKSRKCESRPHRRMQVANSESVEMQIPLPERILYGLAHGNVGRLVAQNTVTELEPIGFRADLVEHVNDWKTVVRFPSFIPSEVRNNVTCRYEISFVADKETSPFYFFNTYFANIGKAGTYDRQNSSAGVLNGSDERIVFGDTRCAEYGEENEKRNKASGVMTLTPDTRCVVINSGDYRNFACP